MLKDVGGRGGSSNHASDISGQLQVAVPAQAIIRARSRSGFGPMWRKTYRVQLSGSTITPVEVIKVWRENFPNFWPSSNRFYGPLTGIRPGEVALLTIGDPLTKTPVLSTGIMVIHADDDSFTFMNAEGHLFAGWINFSATEEDGTTMVQAQALVRTSDPVYELFFRLGVSRQEDLHWQHTLRSLAAHFGVQAEVQTEAVCLDPSIQWSNAKNIWQNAGVRTVLHRISTPLRWLRKRAGQWRRDVAAQS